MKRIGYVGLSTPILYDYRNPAKTTVNDANSSPNPILEGAFGALLLYDELWFLCRSLCPENMRQLPYIKFMDEVGLVPRLEPRLLKPAESIFDPAALSAFHNSSSNYEHVKNQANIYWDAAADNHTHTLIINDNKLSGNSWYAQNVIIDMKIVQGLPSYVELITNSFTANLFRTEASVRDRLVLSELLVLDSVPQFITPTGPYHPSLEEVRNSSYLNNFRKWMSSESPDFSQQTMRQIKQEVDAKLAEAQSQLFLKYLSPIGSYKSVASTMLGVGLDIILPGAGTIKDLVGEYAEEREKEGIRWQGFLIESRAKIKSNK